VKPGRYSAPQSGQYMGMSLLQVGKWGWGGRHAFSGKRVGTRKTKMDAWLKPSAALKTLKTKADPSRFGARDDSVILGRNASLRAP
jgi:hypothetical protein